MTVSEKLRELQGDRTQEAFAAALGICQASLSQIYSRKRRVGMRVMRAAARLHPEAADELSRFFIAENITTGDTDNNEAA